MSRPLVHFYYATSIDGFVADEAGGVGFLDPFQGDVGYPAFMASIGTVVMGRSTFDQLLSFPFPWPYKGKTCMVLTSRPIDQKTLPADAKAGEFLVFDSVDKCIEQLRARFPAPASASVAAAPAMPGGTLETNGIWCVGGPLVMSSFLERGFLDRITLTVVPVMLGTGVPTLKLAAKDKDKGKPKEGESKAAAGVSGAAGDKKEATESKSSAAALSLPLSLTLRNSTTFKDGLVQMIYEVAVPAAKPAAKEGDAKAS